MDDAGVDRIGINARGKRYFSNMIYQDRPELRQFLFSDTMAQICRATLGDEAYLFWEQYVIKAGDPDTSFAWHQDSGYVHEDHEPYLTVLDRPRRRHRGERRRSTCCPTRGQASSPTSSTSPTR